MTMTRTPAANRFQPIDRPGHLRHMAWPAKRSAMQSIPDRYFAEAAACDSVGVIATTWQDEEQGMTTATWNGATIAEVG